jgi:hypothetical protein
VIQRLNTSSFIKWERRGSMGHGVTQVH